MSSRVSWMSAVALVASASAIHATPFDGLYAPAGSFESWSCKSEELGGDGGAVGVMNGNLHGVENDCKLTNPTNVRGMDAILYDAVCSGEGEQYSYRLMLMRHDRGIYLIGNGYAGEWRSYQ